MKFSKTVKPLSYLKTHYSEVEKNIEENQKAQESFALLKILELSGREIKKGKYKKLYKSFDILQKRLNDFRLGQHKKH